jgi:hypothetical protein
MKNCICLTWQKSNVSREASFALMMKEHRARLWEDRPQNLIHSHEIKSNKISHDCLSWITCLTSTAHKTWEIDWQTNMSVDERKMFRMNLTSWVTRIMFMNGDEGRERYGKAIQQNPCKLIEQNLLLCDKLTRIPVWGMWVLFVVVFLQESLSLSHSRYYTTCTKCQIAFLR